MSYEIISDPTRMEIRVGSTVFTAPLLNGRTELDFDIKEAVCEDRPEQADVMYLHRFYSERLGPKFNRRFQAANYWLWIGNRMTPTTGNMLRMGRKSWRWYSNDLVARANQCLPYVTEAENDGLFHLIPAIVLFQASPSAIRQQVGGATWRRIAHNSRTRNARLMQTVWYMHSKLATERFVWLLDFPSGVLNAVHGVEPEAEAIAARITPLKTSIAFQHTAHVVRDTMRMLGDRFNSGWSLQRMTREHDQAALEARRKHFSAEPFADPWVFEAGGFRGDLLVSPLEIAVEGDAMHHCVGSYAADARLKQYAVLRIDGAERATAGYWRKTGGWHLDQVYGACNAAVTDKCRAFASAAGAVIPKPVARAAA